MHLIIQKPREKSRLLLEHFDPHQIIGIDFDKTLIGHKHSPKIQEYILYHPDKEFHLITFRSHGWQNRLDTDLLASTKETGIPLILEAFSGIHNMSDAGYQKHLAMMKTGNGDPDYVAWKAVKCVEVGCTILIDDLADGFHIDCVERDVVIVSPDDFDL